MMLLRFLDWPKLLNFRVLFFIAITGQHFGYFLIKVDGHRCQILPKKNQRLNLKCFWQTFKPNSKLLKGLNVESKLGSLTFGQFPDVWVAFLCSSWINLEGFKALNQSPESHLTMSERSPANKLTLIWGKRYYSNLPVSDYGFQQ